MYYINIPLGEKVIQIRSTYSKIINLAQSEFVTTEKRVDNLFWIVYLTEKKTEVNFEKQVAFIPFRKDVKLSYPLPIILRHFIAFLLTKEGFISLHASAIKKNDKAILFLGPQGAGKTTASDLLPYRKISDDFTIIKKGTNKFFVFPSIFEKKRIQKAYPDAIPLNKIYILKKSKLNKFEVISSTKKLKELVNNSFSFLIYQSKTGKFNPFVSSYQAKREMKKYLRNKKNFDKIIYFYYFSLLELIKNIPIVKLRFNKKFQFDKMLVKQI